MLYRKFLFLGGLLLVLYIISSQKDLFLSPQTQKNLKNAPLESSLIRSLESASATDSFPGSGDSIICGQTAKIHLVGLLPDGKEFENTRNSSSPITFTIGEGKIIKGIELGTLSMRKGGIRKMTLPPELSSKDINFHYKDLPQDKNISFEVELLEITPELPKSTMPLKWLEDYKNNLGNIGAMCGDEIELKYIIYDAHGALLRESKEYLKIRLGDKSIPIAFTKSLNGIAVGDKRSLIIPPAWQKSLNGEPISKTITGVNFPENQVLTFEFERIGKEEKSTSSP